MRAHLTTLALLSLTLAACSSTTGPSAPSVAGIWTGTWRGSTVQLTLTQQGDQVSGSLRVSRVARQVTGTVSADGTLRITSEVRQSDCSVYDSDRLTVDSGAGTLSGLLFKTTGQRVCDGSGGRVGVEQGMLSLSR
jgi:hypothetical protein